MRAWIGIGANLGDAVATVRRAVIDVGALPGCRPVTSSSLYRTAPVGYTAQPDFINAVAVIATTLDPHALLYGLQRLEAGALRRRSFRNAPRTLDLDLLLYDDRTIASPDLVIPHPRLHERAFVLAPLEELDRDLVIPGRGRVAELLAAVTEQTIERLAP